jgi:hypothetical protein
VIWHRIGASSLRSVQTGRVIADCTTASQSQARIAAARMNEETNTSPISRAGAERRRRRVRAMRASCRTASSRQPSGHGELACGGQLSQSGSGTGSHPERTARQPPFRPSITSVESTTLQSYSYVPPVCAENPHGRTPYRGPCLQPSEGARDVDAGRTTGAGKW